MPRSGVYFCDRMGTLRFQDPLSADWVALLFVLVLAQLAWTNVTSPKKWRLVMEGAFRTRISRRSMREEIDLQDRSLLGLWWAALVGGALFIYQVLVQSTLLPNGGLRYLEVFSLLALVAVAQVFLQRAVSFVFRGDGGLHEYTYSLVLSYLTMGLSLLPVSVLVTYRPDQRPWLLLVGVSIIALVVVLRWARAVLIGRSAGVPFRHIFIYLCAAEILPVVILLHALRASGPPSDPLL